jgi:hypothetical protein
MIVREWTLDEEIFITIDNEDGSHTTMPKSVYDAQQAKLNNPVGGN